MNLPYDSRLNALIEGLIERSEAPSPKNSLSPQIQWEQSAEDQFELSLPKSTIRVSSRDGDGQHPFDFKILDQNGRVVEEVETDNRSDYDISRLYRAASRSFRKVDEKISEIMAELGIEEKPAVAPQDPWKDAAVGDDEPPF